MCGIIGYIGEQDAVEIIYSGLEKLEYRGYDSAGIAVLKEGRLSLAKEVGKLRTLNRFFLENLPSGATAGIGHTRWATHGRPTTFNAHPHHDTKKEFLIAHNGIIENYLSLKKELEKRGHQFATETDTEVIAHLCAEYRRPTLRETLTEVTRHLEGAYALALISPLEPDVIVITRKECPVIIGLGQGENFIASDVTAILNHTRDIIFLEDFQFAEVRRDSVRGFDREGRTIELKSTLIEYNPVSAEKAGYSHFMLKEIHEQPQVVRFTIGGRTSEEEGKIYLNEIGLTGPQIYNIQRIVYVACGTAYYSCLVGKSLIEQMVRIPVEVELASEFRYKGPIVDERTLVIGVSQSGETADTLAAVREAKKRGALVIGIINAKGSTLSRELAGVLYIHAGPEIGVASTKAYMGMLIAHILLALYFGKIRATIPVDRVTALIRELKHIPQQIDAILARGAEIERIAQKFHRSPNFLYLGRGLNLPTALEGALKLKEISYIHAEAYASGELKHGPIALVSREMPVVCIATDSPVYEKIVSNMKEVSSREGRLIALATEGNTALAEFCEEVIYVPACSHELSPLLNVLPLQLLAYHVACLRGADVDQPRNLAKSVTVE